MAMDLQLTLQVPAIPMAPVNLLTPSVSRRPRQLLSVSESPSKILARHHPALRPKVLTVFAFAQHHSCNDGKQKTVQVQVLSVYFVWYTNQWDVPFSGPPSKL
jgi:hypothetical protein